MQLFCKPCSYTICPKRQAGSINRDGAAATDKQIQYTVYKKVAYNRIVAYYL